MQTLLSNNFTDSELLKGNVCFYIFYLIQLFSQLTFGCSQILRGRTHFFTLTLIFCLNSLRTWSVSCSLLWAFSFSEQCEVTKFSLCAQLGSNQWEPLCFLLSSYYFLYANVRHGLIHQLLQTYILFGKRALKLVFF